MPTDEQLVAEALDGSTQAFGRLVERYRERLLRFLLTRCRTRADAEDALQESFVNAWRYLDSFDSRWRFSTWLYRIAIRNARAVADRRGELESGGPEAVAGGPGPLEECVLESERENLWLVAKRVLSEEAFAVMWLRYGEDMAVKDVARALERTQSWTKVVLMRARRRLGRELGRETAERKEGKAYG